MKYISKQISIMFETKFKFSNIFILLSIAGGLINSADALECYVCSSNILENCSSLENELPAELCTKDVTSCYTKIQNGITTRGCFPPKNSMQTFECSNSKGCALCDLNKCNHKIIPSVVRQPCGGSGCDYPTNSFNLKNDAKIQTCIECDSQTDPRCQKQTESFNEKTCKLNEGCYLSVDGDNVKRGCVGDLSEEQKKICTSQSDSCKTCVGKNCNQKVAFQNCYSCISSSSAECTEIGASTDTVVCKNYLSTCIIGFDWQGNTHRRCSEGKAIDEHEIVDYAECSKDNCNKYIFPKDHLRCYQCENCETTENVIPKACDLYFQDLDDCYTHIVDEKIYRGCTSDSNKIAERPTCIEDPENCVKCNKHRCNNQPQITLPKLSCISCHDSDSCAFSQNPEDSVACKNQVPFPMTESCFSRPIGAADVKRGCTLDGDKDDIKSCADPSQNCTKCTGSKCNIGNVHYSSCLQCDSQNNNDCRKLEDINIETLSVLCNKTKYPYSKKGCFTIEIGGPVTRGCYADLIDEELKACIKDDQCTLCTEDNCNKEPISASTQIIANYLLIFSIFFAILY